MKVKRVKLTYRDYVIRMAVIFFAALAPYVCLLGGGYQNSLSAYWETDLQPIFIFANALTSYYLYSMPSWRVSALLLLILTAFSVELYPIIHNIVAITFFLVTIWPLYKAGRYKWIIWPYIASLTVLPWSMFFAEVVAINSLCLYHGMLLYHTYHLTKES